MCEKSVLDPIPHTQHRPICVSVNQVIVAQPTTFRRRFNLKKADWEGFSADLDRIIEEVDAIPENYERFVEMLRMTSRKDIPRGCSSNYIPGLTDESKSLCEACKKQYSIDPFGETTIETGNTLIDTMKDEKKKSWIGLDITRFCEQQRQPSSGSAWPACPKNGKSGPHCWGRGGSTQFAQQLESAVTAPPLVGCVVWSFDKGYAHVSMILKNVTNSKLILILFMTGLI